ncbi:MAG: hypothetical protein J6W75_05685 [Bacteroidaceae bacterium]|nr:hypothetical protein [Bacteroidaceae bacterium]
MPEKELDVSRHFCYFAERANDTYFYVRGIELKGEAYYALDDSSGTFQTAEKARQLYMKYGKEREAAQVYAAAIHFFGESRTS